MRSPVLSCFKPLFDRAIHGSRDSTSGDHALALATLSTAPRPRRQTPTCQQTRENKIPTQVEIVEMHEAPLLAARPL
jgi:hypothetical protein